MFNSYRPQGVANICTVLTSSTPTSFLEKWVADACQGNWPSADSRLICIESKQNHRQSQRFEWWLQQLHVLYCILLYCIIAEIKIVVTKASFNLKTFHQQNEMKSKEETNKVLHLEHSFVWRWNLSTLESGSKMPAKSWNVVLGKGSDQLDRSCEKWRSVTESYKGEEYRTDNKCRED